MKKNGVRWEEGMPMYAKVEPGPEHSANWQPYKLWTSDLWECPNCKHELITGHAFEPLAEHHQKDYQQKKEIYDVTLRINDC